MEPTEASTLDNQYKYYWEGDLCGRASLGDGAALGACPACGGWAASSPQSGPEAPPRQSLLLRTLCGWKNAAVRSLRSSAVTVQSGNRSKHQV